MDCSGPHPFTVEHRTCNSPIEYNGWEYRMKKLIALMLMAFSSTVFAVEAGDILTATDCLTYGSGDLDRQYFEEPDEQSSLLIRNSGTIIFHLNEDGEVDLTDEWLEVTWKEHFGVTDTEPNRKAKRVLPDRWIKSENLGHLAPIGEDCGEEI